MIYQLDNIPPKISIVSDTLVQFDDSFFSFFISKENKKIYLNGDNLLFSVNIENEIYDPWKLLKRIRINFGNFNVFIGKILKNKVKFSIEDLDNKQLGLLKPFIDDWELTQKACLNCDIDFLIEFENQLLWRCVCVDCKLNEAAIEMFQNKLDFTLISMHQTLSEQFIEKFANKVDWLYISIYQKLSEEFIEKHQDKVDWTCISRDQDLSEGFFEKFGDKIDWRCVSIVRKLEESFIEKYQNLLNWDLMSEYQKMSEKFIRKFQDKVNWKNIFHYQKISKEFTMEFRGR